MARSKIVGGVAALALVAGLTSASLLSSCTPETYTDQNFGTNLGADFVAPPADAASNTNEVDAGGAD
jgi:hypothetical protein